MNTVISHFPDESRADEAAYQEREFVRHFNGLLQALNDFAASYKTGLVDVKKVKAVRKALHELEKSEWFKYQRAAPGAAPDAHKLRRPSRAEPALCAELVEEKVK
jgi:hypothetical protein